MSIKKTGKFAGQKNSERTNAELPASLKTSQSLSFKSRLNASAEHKKPFKIKERYTALVLFETEAETLKDAVEEAVELQVDLCCADLRKADLRGAWLANAQLSNADFSGASLFNATLWRAALRGARFCNVDLRYADFRYATLKKAALRNSELICTGFRGSNLVQADFRGSNLEGAELRGANLTSTSFDRRAMAPKEGSFIGWKTVYDIQGNMLIAKLLILEDAPRTTPLFGQMCRAESVKVLELSREIPFAKCKFLPDRIYYVGGIVHSPDYSNDDNIQTGVTDGGIHFYLTREEVRQYIWYPPVMPTTEYWNSAEYKGWIKGTKFLNQPDNQESRWQAGKLFNAHTANLMNQWDEETNAGNQALP